MELNISDIMPPTKSSSIWNYFIEKDEDPSTALCQVPGCSKMSVSRGKLGTIKSALTVQSMKRHLQLNHTKQYHEFIQNEKEKLVKEKEATDDDLEENDMTVFNLRTQKQRDQFKSQLKISSWINDGGKASSSKFETYLITDPRAKERHVAVLMMVVLDLQPFTIVNDPGFIYYSNRMDSHFKVGSETYYRNCLQKAYEKGVDMIKEKIDNDQAQFVSCQLDGWSSYRHGYMGLLINYITSSWKRVSLCIGCTSFDQSHTGWNIAEWLEGKLDSWKVFDKTTVMISDTASNMIKAAEYLPSLVHSGCLNHIIQLSINHEILEKPSIKNLILNLKAFSTYASKSNLLSEELRKLQREAGVQENMILMPKQDCVTRWNSTYDMIERAIEIEDYIKVILADDHWKSKIKCEGNQVKLTTQDWKLLKSVARVLKPFKEATEVLSKANASISQYIPVITSLLYTLRPLASDDGVKQLKSRLKENLLGRLSDVEEYEIYSLATLLDPRYKNCVFRCEESTRSSEGKLLEILTTEFAKPDYSENIELEVVEDPLVNTNASADDEGFFGAMSAIKKKPRLEVHDSGTTPEDVLKEYFEGNLIPHTSSPLNWWAKYQEKHKTVGAKQALCVLARKYLTPPPTSTNCERLFSVAGQVMDEKRSNLLPDNLDKILFLRENIKEMNFNLDW